MGPLELLVGISESPAAPNWRHGLTGDFIRSRFGDHHFAMPDGACRGCSEALDHQPSAGPGAGANQ